MKLYLGGYFSIYSNYQLNIIIDLENPKTLTEILTQANIPVGDVYLAAINGKFVSLNETIINNDDEVKIYPYVSGG